MAGENFTVDQVFLKSRYDYNPETGQLIAKNTGKMLGWLKNKYLYIDIYNKHYKVHRIIWMMVYGRWPNQMIDHINGIKTDNRLINLQEVNVKQNAENRSLVWAKSGFRGVVPAPNGRWKAQIVHNKKTFYLGTYDTKEEAHQAYKKTAMTLFTNYK